MPERPDRWRSDEEARTKLETWRQRHDRLGLGLRFLETRASEGRFVAELDPGPDQKNQAGGVHGGMLALLADVVAGAGVICSIPDQDWCTTLELGISYLGRFREPPLRIEARALHRGGRTQVWEVAFADASGRNLAKARLTFLVTQGRRGHGSGELPAPETNSPGS